MKVPTPDYRIGLATRTLFAVAEQGLFALGSLGLHIFLARWLSATEYGAFSTVYAVYALLALVHSAALIEPMLAFGPGRYRTQVAHYLSCVARSHAVIVVAIASVFLVSSFFFRWVSNDVLAACTAGAALGVPGLLTVGLARRAHYMRLELGYPLVVGLVYLTLLLTGLSALSYWGRLNLVTAWFLIAACAFLAGYVLLRAPYGSVAALAETGGILEVVLREHLVFARWAVPAAVAGYFVGGMYYYLLPVTYGLESVGSFRAAINLAIPGFHALAAIGFLTSAAIAKHVGRGVDPQSAVTRIGLQALVGLLLYVATILSFGDRIVSLLYGSTYEFSQTILVIIAFLPVSYLGPAIFCAGLRAIERPRRVFEAALFTLLSAGGVGVVLTWQQGVLGALVGTLLGYTTFGIIAYCFWQRERRLTGSPSPSSYGTSSHRIQDVID